MFCCLIVVRERFLNLSFFQYISPIYCWLFVIGFENICVCFLSQREPFHSECYPIWCTHLCQILVWTFNREHLNLKPLEVQGDVKPGSQPSLMRYMCCQWMSLCRATLESSLRVENLLDVIKNCDDQTTEVLSVHLKFVIATLKHFIGVWPNVSALPLEIFLVAQWWFSFDRSHVVGHEGRMGIYQDHWGQRRSSQVSLQHCPNDSLVCLQGGDDCSWGGPMEMHTFTHGKGCCMVPRAMPHTWCGFNFSTSKAWWDKATKEWGVGGAADGNSN